MQENEIRSANALDDNRPQHLKDKDYSTEEVVGATLITPFIHVKPLKPSATEFNQWYTGSCVPHGFLTQLEYEGIATPDISRLRAYRKRVNYPQEGSIGVDIYDQIRSGQSNDFSTPEYFTEQQATAMLRESGYQLIKDFKYFQYIDKATGELLLENVPVDVANGKAVSIFIYATQEEWSKEYVEVIDENLTANKAHVRHCVCILPKGDFTENGKQWLAVQDSAKFGGRGLRYIEYDKFFLGRTYFACKVYAVKDIPVPEPILTPKPTEPCEIGDKNISVLALQKYLIKEGKLKPEYQTGYYGAITAKAVLWWQLEHWDRYDQQKANIPILLEYAGKYWGQGSIDIVNTK